MRIAAAVVISVLISAFLSVGITHHIMREHTRQEVDRMEVTAFNDGFRDGSCYRGFDGFGHPCK